MLQWFRKKRDRPFVDWAKKNAITIDLARDMQQTELLSPLDPLLENKRIVFLGESNHFIHQKNPYRLLFLSWLYSRGWRFLAEEISWSDGWYIQKYLNSNQANYLEKVATYGYKGAKRSDRNDVPEGVLQALYQNQPTKELGAEQMRFIKNISTLGPWRFFGFDVDYEPGLGYEVLSNILEEKLDAPLAQTKGESIDEEIVRIEHAVEQEIFPEEIRHIIQNILEGLRYIKLAYPAPDYASLAPAMAHREAVMHKNVDYILSQMGPEDKLVLLGHNLHLAKNDKIIEKPGQGVGPGGDQLSCVGTYITQKYPEEVLGVWLLNDQGTDLNPLPESDRIVRSVPGSLNALLAEVGESFILPTRTHDSEAKKAFETKRKIVSVFDYRVKACISEQADILCFVKHVSSLRA